MCVCVRVCVCARAVVSLQLSVEASVTITFYIVLLENKGMSRSMCIANPFTIAKHSVWKGPGVLLLWIVLCWGHVRVLLAVLLKTDHNSSKTKFCAERIRGVLRRNYEFRTADGLSSQACFLLIHYFVHFKALVSTCHRWSSVWFCYYLIWKSVYRESVALKGNLQPETLHLGTSANSCNENTWH